MKSDDTPMTSPLAMTAKTPMASSTFIHTPEEERATLSKPAPRQRAGERAGGTVTLTDVVGLLGNESALQRDHFNGVQANLDDVVNERQQRGERKGGHEYGGEAELDHWEHANSKH